MKPMWEWAVDINGGTMPLRMLELVKLKLRFAVSED